MVSGDAGSTKLQPLQKRLARCREITGFFYECQDRRRFGWIIQLNQLPVVAAMALSPVLCMCSGREWPDVPGANAEGVGHG